MRSCVQVGSTSSGEALPQLQHCRLFSLLAVAEMAAVVLVSLEPVAPEVVARLVLVE